MLDCFTRSFNFQSWIPPPVSGPGFSRVSIPPFSGVVNIFHFLSPNLLRHFFTASVDFINTNAFSPSGMQSSQHASWSSLFFPCRCLR